MHRQNASPPIHHPVPQRPVQVPVMQSPPPPSQSSDPYDNPYASAYPPQGQQLPGQQPHPGQQPAYGQFGGFSQGVPGGPGGFFADPMTAQLGFNVARAAMSGGQDFAEGYVRPARPPPPAPPPR